MSDAEAIRFLKPDPCYPCYRHLYRHRDLLLRKARFALL